MVRDTLVETVLSFSFARFFQARGTFVWDFSYFPVEKISGAMGRRNSPTSMVDFILKLRQTLDILSNDEIR